MLMQLADDAGPYIVGGAFFLILLAFVAILVASAFWLWMLIDCIKNRGLDDNERLIWIVVICFSHLLGAILYCAIARGKRIRPTGS